MNWYKGIYYYIIAFGIVVTGISFIIDYTIGANYFIKFMLVIITFSINVFIKMIANQYMSLKQYNLINTLAVSGIFKMLLILFQFYKNKSGIQWGAEIWILMMQCYLVEMESLILAYFLAQRQLKLKISKYVVAIGYFMIIIMCHFIHWTYIKMIFPYSMLVSIVIVSILVLKGKDDIQTILYEATPYFRVQLYFVLGQYVVGYMLIGQWQNYGMVIIIFQFLQAIYLFGCGFHICLQSPWQQRMYALTEADKKIDKQCERCDTIVNLSHELKTPVNVIRSALDILELDVDVPMKEEVKEIKRNCHSVMNIIQDMIDIQKINTHHIEINIQKYNLVELFENVVDAFAEQVQDAQLIFNPKEEEMNGEVDGLLMQQCFMLLMGMLIQRDKTQKVYIELNQKVEVNEIYMSVRSSNVSGVRELDDVLKCVSEKEEIDEHVEDLMTLKLIYSLLEVQEITLDFGHDKKEIFITFKIHEEGKRNWLNERSIAVLNDQIKCRYVVG